MRLTYLVAISFALLTFSACKTAKKVSEGNKQSSPEISKSSSKNSGLSEREKIDLNYIFFNANKEKLLGNYDEAYTLFKQCIKKDPYNDACFYALGQITAQQKKYSEALGYIKIAINLNNQNNWYKVLYADVLEKNKEYTEAAEVYEKLSKDNPDSPEYYFEWASALFYADKVSDAIKVYDKLENKIGLTPEVSVQKEKLYIKLGKVDKAAEELQKLINAFPSDPTYYGMLADLYLANGVMDKALNLYNKVLEIDPDNGVAHLSLADYYRTKGDNEKSFAELKKVFSNKNVEIETKFKILSSYFALVEQNPTLKDQALELNKILVETHPNEGGSHVFYGEFLYQSKKFEEARDEYRKAIELDKKNFSVWQQLLRVELDLKDYQAIEKESEEALELFPNQPFIFYVKGIAHSQLKKYNEAIETLTTGVKLIVDNPPLSADFYANIGEAYYRLKKFKLSNESFDKAVSLDPANANTLNNYSYYLSERGDSLDKAEAMSRKCNELEPNNSYYQDTYGWILYRQGKYKEAKEWIEKAMKARDGESSVIFEHYGDILYKLGDKEQAVQYWQKAKNVGSGSELLEKKLSDKKLYE